MKTILDAQHDMRTAYFYGVPGIITSGSVWLIAGVVAYSIDSLTGILTLVFGGMFIFPISVVLCKVFGRSGKHEKDNPLAPLAIEGTFWMLLSIPVAAGAAFYKLEWFFPAMILVIAGRYLTFSTIYGMRLYWVFGAVLVLSALGLLILNAPVYLSAITGGVVELLFALLIFIYKNQLALTVHKFTMK